MDFVRACEKSDAMPVDLDDLLKRCLGRIDLAERILQTFQTALESDVKQLEAAVLATDVDEIAHLAHRIKGASLAVSAHKLTECAKCLELSAKSQCLDELPGHMASLKRESSRLNVLSNMVVDGTLC